MKRVLYVSSIFPPMVAGGAPRAAQFCKYLPELGWLPTVLTVQSDAATAVDQQSLDELDKNVEIVRAFSPLSKVAVRGAPNPRSGLSGIRRVLGRSLLQFALIPDRYITWSPWAIKAGRRALTANKHDAVFATYGPASNLVIGAKLARWAKLPLLVDFRDLWGDDPLGSFITPAHRWTCRRMERKIVGQAQHVIAVAPAMARKLAESHKLPANKIHSITNGFDPADLARARDTREPGRHPFRLCYTGSVDKHHDFGPFFQVIRQMAAAGEITPRTLQVTFVGNLAAQEPRRAGVGDFVECLPSVPHHEVFRRLAGADALLMLEAPGYWAEYSYSAKVFDYLLTGRPVLALVEADGNSARLLGEAGVAHVAHPCQGEEIRSRLRNLIALKGTPPRAIDIQAEPYRRFDRRRLTGALAELLDDATQTAAPPNKEARSAPVEGAAHG